MTKSVKAIACVLIIFFLISSAEARISQAADEYAYELCAKNNIYNCDGLRIGMEITLNRRGDKYTVRPGETLSAIAVDKIDYRDPEQTVPDGPAGSSVSVQDLAPVAEEKLGLQRNFAEDPQEDPEYAGDGESTETPEVNPEGQNSAEEAEEAAEETGIDWAAFWAAVVLWSLRVGVVVAAMILLSLLVLVGLAIYAWHQQEKKDLDFGGANIFYGERPVKLFYFIWSKMGVNPVKKKYEKKIEDFRKKFAAKPAPKAELSKSSVGLDQLQAIQEPVGPEETTSLKPVQVATESSWEQEVIDDRPLIDTPVNPGNKIVAAVTQVSGDGMDSTTEPVLENVPPDSEGPQQVFGQVFNKPDLGMKDVKQVRPKPKRRAEFEAKFTKASITTMLWLPLTVTGHLIKLWFESGLDTPYKIPLKEKVNIRYKKQIKKHG